MVKYRTMSAYILEHRDRTYMLSSAAGNVFYALGRFGLKMHMNDIIEIAHAGLDDEFDDLVTARLIRALPDNIYVVATGAFILRPINDADDPYYFDGLIDEDSIPNVTLIPRGMMRLHWKSEPDYMAELVEA